MQKSIAREQGNTKFHALVVSTHAKKIVGISHSVLVLIARK